MKYFASLFAILFASFALFCALSVTNAANLDSDSNAAHGMMMDISGSPPNGMMMDIVVRPVVRPVVVRPGSEVNYIIF
jgi:hypothetical protein